jgi:hypothetical protein
MNSDFPFKGKPTTNNYVHAAFFEVLFAVWLTALILYTSHVMIFTLLVVLFMLFRRIFRDIKKEWTGR